MIEHDISDHIVTISIDYRKPRGGIAQVLNLYSSFYQTYNFITTTTGENVGKLSKATLAAKSYLQFMRYMLDKNIKIVHVHSASGASFFRKAFFVTTAKAFKKKVILHIHGGKFKEFTNEHPKIVKSIIDKSDCIVALSENWKKYFSEKYPHKKVYIINNPIESPVFLDKEGNDESDSKASSNLTDRTPASTIETTKSTHAQSKDKIVNVCFLGKICDEKGVFDLLEVLKNHRDKYQGRLRLIIGGNGEVERLKKYVADNHMEGLVEYVGWVNGQSKIQLYNDAHALILPSYFEGVPLCILEAMSYGLTVAATDVGGIPEVIEHGENGYMFKPGDFEGIEKVLDLIVSNPSDKPIFHEQAKSSVMKHHLQEVEKSLTELYKSLLKDS